LVTYFGAMRIVNVAFAATHVFGPVLRSALTDAV
jgi:hypothetical protein